MATICGLMALIIALFSAYEAIVRRVASPTSWTLDVSCYILIWIFFAGSSYAFQEGSHVGVDMVRDFIDKHTHSKVPRRVLAVIGYLITEVFLGVLLKGSLSACRTDLLYDMETATSHPFPMIWLHLAMVIGLIMMMLTVLFMMLDCFTDSEEFL
ncbi:MAG: TRAP transporter small permease [Oscillospiraceae bacterium]